jgi:hypothetical protein
MRLKIDAEPAVDNPTAGDIRDTLQRLNLLSGPVWAVLEVKSSDYIQAGVVEDGQLAVEYREGGADRHYTAGGRLHREAVIDAFVDYLLGGNGWRTAFEWRRMKLA